MIFFGTANLFADVALWLWFAVGLLLFWKLQPPVAAALTVLGGRLFLPEAVHVPLPVFPDLDKYSIPPLAALLGCLCFARPWLARSRLRAPAIDRWFVLLLAGHVATYLTNRDALDEERPALSSYDLITAVCEDLVIIYLVFVLGRALFRSARELRTLMLACVGLALLYTPFCMFEFVMGPRSHYELYGFYQHEIVQTLRAGGFRPMVFLSHGIVLARFLLMALLCAAVAVRARASGKIGLIAVAYLFVMLVAVKSMGALILALAFLPLVLIGSAKAISRVAVVVALIVGLYPLLRGADVFPTDTLVGWATQIHEERADSLGGRFEQEDMLLERARERLLFGWGAYGRSRIYDEKGEDLSVTDGEWIIVLGGRGLTGYLAWYALYLVPIFAARKHLRRIIRPQHRMLVAGFALINAVLAIDTLPNAPGSLPHFFWAGALYGATYGIMRSDRLLRLQVRWQQRRKQAERSELPRAARRPVSPIPAGGFRGPPAPQPQPREPG
jgi:hypothetical protein